MVRIRTSNPNNTNASSDEMVSLRQMDPPRIHNDSGGRSINMVYRIIFLGTAVALVVLWGSKFVAHKHEQQQRYQLRIQHDASGDDHMDELDSLEQEQELEQELELELAEREKAAKDKEDELAKREKEVAASSSSSSSSSSSASAKKKEGKGKGNKNQEKSKTKPSTNTGSSWEDAAWERMNSIKREQVENYRSQQALMLNIHATHHGGTAFCGRIGRNGINETIAPAFACMGDRDNVMPDPPDCRVGKAKSHTAGVDPEFCYSYSEMTSHKGQMPWAKEQTGPFIDAIRPYFHMISWEFAGPVENRKDHSMDDPDYEHPNLVSVLVTREPISRLLAGDGIIGKKYPGYKTQELNRTRWWDYAVYDGQKESDNFFLRILTGAKRPTRKKSNATNHITKGIYRSTNYIMELFPTGLDKSHFEHGKSLMDRFTFVLDVACFDAGMQAMGNLLEMGLPPLKTPSKSTIRARSGTKALSPKERIGYDDVYEYLVAKNEWDIKLYEYSKTISLINCDELDEVP